MKTLTIERTGNFKKLNNFLEKSLELFNIGVLDKYGRMGVKALSEATPEESGKTSSAWSYKIVRTTNSASLVWTNDNVVDGANIALLIQYGHATRSGSWVEGIDYINPALMPVFEQMKEDILKELK